MRLGFIGGGNMAEALLRGVLRSGLASPGEVVVSEPREERREQLRERHGVEVVWDNAEAVRRAEVVVLAVKPRDVERALEGVEFTAEHLVLSIVAGLTLGHLQGMVRPARTVRTMPNLAATVGAAITALCPSPQATAQDLETARSLFSSVGDTVVVDEELMDAVTALSGSGPAYGLLFLEALADGGIAAGLPGDLALRLAAHALLGAARLTLDSGEHPAALRQRICSPRGTTVQGIQVLERQGVRGAAMEAVQAAWQQAQRLGSWEGPPERG